MAGKGSPKGVRQGGRKKGSPNKKMTPRDARTIKAAESLNREIAERRPQPGTEAAEKIMGKFAHNCAAMAVRLMPSQDQNGDLVFRHDEHKTWWKFMMELTFKYANGAAPYQSPTFRAIVVTPPPTEPGAGQNMRVVNMRVFDAVGVAVASEVIEDKRD